MGSVTPTEEDFRSVVLRGANVASYKFALAKSILALAESGTTSASLEDLAVPFSHELCEHLTQVDTQSTSSGSKFLAVPAAAATRRTNGLEMFIEIWCEYPHPGLGFRF